MLPCVPDYRRNRVPGGTFFFTVSLLDRRSDLLVTQIQALRDAVRQVQLQAPFRIDAHLKAIISYRVDKRDAESINRCRRELGQQA